MVQATTKPFVEFQVRESRRFIVTRYQQTEHTRGSTQKGEYVDPETAYQVAYALCKAEHDAAGTPPGDLGFIYPKHPTEGEATASPSYVEGLSKGLKYSGQLR